MIAEVDALLESILGDSCGDDEQLTLLAEGIANALDLPQDVRVVGEPLSLVAVSYDGNERRGLVGRCRREDGTEYNISLADVELPPRAAGYLQIAAYCKWLGVPPVVSKPSQRSKATVRLHKAKDEDIDLSKPVDLVVVAVKARAARCRLAESGRLITLRAGSLFRVVPGHIITVEPNKFWRHGGHPYLSGKIASTRIDAAALNLTPLAVNGVGEWDPAQESWGEAGELMEDWAKLIVARGPRPMFAMQQVLPGNDPDDPESDPILEVHMLKQLGDTAGAQDLLSKMLEADLRCLDAHAHLGAMLLDMSPHWAASHYEVGLRIGELSLGNDFDGVLCWAHYDNQPFLRCLHGYGLCLWRLERWENAERVFERILWMNPSDEQAVSLCLPQVRAREAFTATF